MTRSRWAVFTCATLFVVGWTLLSGKDLNWDALNYHLYSGFSALHERIAQDYFPAGAVSYFNPYAQMPFYWMVSAGFPALAIGLVLACIHSLNLWLTYELAVGLHPTEGETVKRTVGLLAVLFAALNPVFLQLIGSSFTDAIVTIPTLAGWLALVRAFRRPTLLHVALAGALLGAATALKLSNALFAIAAVPMVMFLPVRIAQRLRLTVAFGVAGIATFVVVTGPWAWRLWLEFGNPLFPLLNEWFRSPDFVTEPLRHDRFLPDSLADAFLRPLHMALPERMIHTEPRAPDLRYAALLVALAAWAATRFIGRARPRSQERDLPGAERDVRDPALLGLGVAFVAGWTLWLTLSGNSRYFLPMGCVAGVLLAALLVRLARPWPRASLFLAGALVIAQGVQIALGTQPRWTEGAWKGPWFNVTIPERFRHEPYLYLSLSVQSGSFLAAFVSPDSRFMNVSGSYVLGPGRPGGERAQRLIDGQRDRLRMLIPVQSIDTQGNPLPPSFDRLDGRLARFGLRTDPADCAYFQLQGGLDMLRHGPGERPAGDVPATTNFLTCKLVDAPDARERQRDEKRIADAIFDRVEDACPNLFHPRRPVSEKNAVWGRHYVLGSDLQVWIANGWVKYSNPVIGGDPVIVGRAVDWERAPQPLDCSRRRGGGIDGVPP